VAQAGSALAFVAGLAGSAPVFVVAQGDSVQVVSAEPGVFAEPVWLALDGLHWASSNYPD
jgi:hypothetical protein